MQEPIFIQVITTESVRMASQSKAWVCGRSLSGIAGSNPAGDMDVYHLCVLCVVR